MNITIQIQVVRCVKQSNLPITMQILAGAATSQVYGHDVINLGIGTYLVSRGSDPTIAEDANVYGDLDISPSEGGLFGYDITINGNGPENTIIDAGNEDRVIDIKDNTRLKLVGVKIYQGNPSDYDGKESNGSGIYNHDTLYVENCLFEKVLVHLTMNQYPSISAMAVQSGRMGD